MEIVGKDEHQQADRSLVQCLNPVMVDTPVTCGQNYWCYHSTNESWDCDELPQCPSPRTLCGPSTLNPPWKGYIQTLPHRHCSSLVPLCCHEEWCHKLTPKQHSLPLNKRKTNKAGIKHDRKPQTVSTSVVSTQYLTLTKWNNIAFIVLHSAVHKGSYLTSAHPIKKKSWSTVT